MQKKSWYKIQEVKSLFFWLFLIVLDHYLDLKWSLEFCLFDSIIYFPVTFERGCRCNCKRQFVKKPSKKKIGSQVVFGLSWLDKPYLYSLEKTSFTGQWRPTPILITINWLEYIITKKNKKEKKKKTGNSIT